jgi:hypothetical protein
MCMALTCVLDGALVARGAHLDSAAAPRLERAHLQRPEARPVACCELLALLISVGAYRWHGPARIFYECTSSRLRSRCKYRL